MVDSQKSETFQGTKVPRILERGKEGKGPKTKGEEGWETARVWHQRALGEVIQLGRSTKVPAMGPSMEREPRRGIQ